MQQTEFELTAANASEYLAARGFPASRIRELGGGVSNIVLWAEAAGREPIVLKQSLEKLRVEQDWFSDRERIHRECDAIRRLHAVLPAGAVPDIVFEDPDRCIYAMTAAPAGAQPWKSALMNGVCDLKVVDGAAGILARIVTATRNDPAWRAAFGDRKVFDQLRLDAYYRAAALRHPDLAPLIHGLIEETLSRSFSLVHGDWSPKNLLVTPEGSVTAIDFEVVHYGDPAFDAGFLINHLLLKSIYRGVDYRPAALRFFEIVAAAVGEPWFEPAVIRHLGALMLARIDGKSPAEYIQSEALRQQVRATARRLILEPPPTLAILLDNDRNPVEW